MKNIVIVLENFPYEPDEDTFILRELEELSKRYKITVISLAHTIQRDIGTLDICNKINILRYNKAKLSLPDAFGCVFSFFSYKGTWKELYAILKESKYVFKRIIGSFLFFVRAYQFKTWISNSGVFENDGNSIFYSYWYTDKVLSAIMLKSLYPQIKIITRTHGYDLYNERVKWGKRQPYKSIMDMSVDFVIFVCEYGKKYYLNNYIVSDLNKYIVNKIGTPSGFKQIKTSQDVFLLVSCSTVNVIKRVTLIIDALKLISDFTVRWIHFGDGSEFNETKKYASELLDKKNNIKYCFMGNVARDEIYDYYSNNYVDCFITTSSTEGCPVSVQEAMAFGIPLICTAVGGIPEMIDGNGYLLPANPTKEQIADAIVDMKNINEADYNRMRNRSYKLWEDNYDISKNSRDFAEFLDSIH